MQKRVFVIHGWEGYPEEGWRPWLRKKLEKRGYTVFIPAMPNTKHPKMNEWLRHLKKIVGTPDENCYFVGHSLGCITILRYLETLKKGQKIGGAIFFAGFVSNLGFDVIGSFFKKPINWKKIKSHCKKFIAVHSDNDPYVSLHYGKIFKKKLDAKVIIKHNMKHFSGDDGIFVLPIALESVIKLSE